VIGALLVCLLADWTYSALFPNGWLSSECPGGANTTSGETAKSSRLCFEGKFPFLISSNGALPRFELVVHRHTYLWCRSQRTSIVRIRIEVPEDSRHHHARVIQRSHIRFRQGTTMLRKTEMSWVTPTILSSDPFTTYSSLLPQVDLDRWNSPDVKARNVSVMRRYSSVHLEVGRSRGGWVFPEKLYVDDPCYVTRAPNHTDALDRYIMQQPMCHSLAVRFDYISRILVPRLIRAVQTHKDHVRIASFGSGTGRDVMAAMHSCDKCVTADCFDLDGQAFVEGRGIAEQLQLTDRVRFIEADFTKVSRESYDIGLMIGIICPLTDTLARRVLKRVATMIVPGGLLLISSSSEKMEMDDPLCRFLIEYSADWFLQFRDAARMDAVITSAGLNIIDSATEPSGFNRLVVAAVNSGGRQVMA
jgi:hypothetical protein